MKSGFYLSPDGWHIVRIERVDRVGHFWIEGEFFAKRFDRSWIFEEIIFSSWERLK